MLTGYEKITIISFNCYWLLGQSFHFMSCFRNLHYLNFLINLIFKTGEFEIASLNEPSLKEGGTIGQVWRLVVEKCKEMNCGLPLATLTSLFYRELSIRYPETHAVLEVSRIRVLYLTQSVCKIFDKCSPNVRPAHNTSNF